MARAKNSPNPVDRYVGLRIRMRRLFLKMSLEELARALRLTYQQVQKYEKGTNRVSASRLMDIASALQVPPAFFFERASASAASMRGSNAAPSPDLVSDFLATSEGLQLIKAFVRIPSPKLRRSIVAFVEQIVPEGI